MNYKKSRWEEENNKFQSIFYLAATVLIVVAMIGMLFNFISYKDAIGLIKRQLPTNYSRILGGGGMQDVHYRVNWQGNLKGRIYLSMSEDMTPQPYYDRDAKTTIAGFLDGKIPMSGITLNLKQISDFPVFYGEKTLKNSTTQKHLQVWVYLLSKGEKEYKTKFVGYVPVDYKITTAIVNANRPQIDPERKMTNKDVMWLTTFTHDSLHQFILSFFKEGKTPELFIGRNIYAYRLDQEINQNVRFKKLFKRYWTGKRTACIGIIYKINQKTYVKVVYNASRIKCHDGGYVFDFWH